MSTKTLKSTVIITYLLFGFQTLFAQNKLVGESDFILYGGHIIVKASVNGSKPINFVFDTGAQAAVIDKGIAKKINLSSDSEVRTMGAEGKTISMPISLNNTVSINGLKFSPSSFMFRDLDRPKERGLIFLGVLGRSQFSDYITEIDYAEKKLRFYDKNSYKYTGKGSTIALNMQIGIPSINVTLTSSDGKIIKGEALIDTGASMAANINTPTVKKYKMIEKSKKTLTREFIGSNGSFKIQQARINSIQIGKHILNNVPVSLSTLESGPLSFPNYVGIIGNHIMKRFKVILDYGNDRMILEPNKYFNSDFPINSSGLVYRFSSPLKNNGIKITTVHKNSPASEIGIKKGDILLKIAKKDIGKYNRDELNKLLNFEGKTISVEWLSDGKHKKGRIKLRNLY